MGYSTAPVAAVNDVVRESLQSMLRVAAERCADSPRAARILREALVSTVVSPPNVFGYVVYLGWYSPTREHWYLNAGRIPKTFFYVVDEPLRQLCLRVVLPPIDGPQLERTRDALSCAVDSFVASAREVAELFDYDVIP